tara:strand:+ start:79 stop:324 length:246 start_codon:yes stop_codon:yes gene_type:complete
MRNNSHFNSEWDEKSITKKQFQWLIARYAKYLHGLTSEQATSIIDQMMEMDIMDERTEDYLKWKISFLENRNNSKWKEAWK